MNTNTVLNGIKIAERDTKIDIRFYEFCSGCSKLFFKNLSSLLVMEICLFPRTKMFNTAA